MFFAWHMGRKLRRWISGGVVLAVLFMQMMVAVHACPVMDNAQGAPASVQAMADMPDCPMAKAPRDQANALCKAHCTSDSQSTAANAAPDLQANPAALTLLLGVIEPAAAGAMPAAEIASPWQLSHSGSPPLYLRLLVLRN